MGERTLTCGLLMNESGGYDVCVMPHWDLDASMIESFDEAGDAFGRHAQISIALRADGWVLADRASHAVRQRAQL